MSTRIETTDDLHGIIVKLSDGNMGSIMAMGSLAEVSERIDPQSAFGMFTGLVGLDENEIYGTDIWTLYQDMCHGNPALVLGVLRAVQLGLLPKADLQEACSRQDRTGGQLVPVKECYDLVRLELDGFDPERIGERDA